MASSGRSDLVTLTNPSQLQTVINAGVKRIRLPAGTFSIPALITPSVGLTLTGAGPGATILDWTGGDNGVMFQRLDASLTPTNILIADLTIQCNSTNAKGLTGIKTRFNSGNRFENITFQGVKTPAYIDRGLSVSFNDIILGSATLNPPGGFWFGSEDQADYLGSLSITNLHHLFGDPDEADIFTDAAAVITLNRVASGSINSPKLHTQFTNKVGIRLENDTQGVDINGGLIVGFEDGIVFDEDPAFPVSLFPTRAPSFCTVDSVAVDQAGGTAVKFLQGSDNTFIVGPITNSDAGIVVGAGAPRINILDLNMNQIAGNGIVLAANVISFQWIGGRVALGPASAGVPFVLSAGVSNGIKVQSVDMRDSNPNGTIFDFATSGVDREYQDNPGAVPVINTLAGTTVRHASQLQTDGVLLVKKTAVGSPPANPQSGYGTVWVGDDNRAYVNTGSDNRPLIDADAIAAAGTILHGTADEAWAGLTLGTANQELAVNAGATAPTWANGILKTLTTAGDMAYATAAATLARLAKGTPFQELTMNAGATAPQWSSGVLALAAAAGDMFHATAANTLAKVSIGAVKTMLTSTGSAPAWSASPVVSGSFTAETGLNVGSATGATTGQVRTSDKIYPSGQTGIGLRVIPAVLVTNGSSMTLGPTATNGTFHVINLSTEQEVIVRLQSAGVTVYALTSVTTGFTINSDAGANIAIFHDGTNYVAKNRSGGSVVLTAWAMAT